MTFDDTLGLPPDTKRDALLTSASIHLDSVGWRTGRRRYAVWAIDVDSAGLRASVIAGPLPPLLSGT